MHKDESLVDEAAAQTREINRRTIAKGVAWTVPVVIVATAAPAAAASPTPAPKIGTPTVTSNKVGAVGAKRNEFTVSFTNSGTAQGRVEVLTMSSSGAGTYVSGLPQVLVVGAAASATTTTITWSYGTEPPKGATFTFNYKVDGGALQSVQITI